jgi:uncharacterized protein YdaU (DUF1376 family)
MPLYVADYRADTAHLSAAQHGAYLLLIMHYWTTGCLPTDDAPLARIAGMTPSEWRKNRPVIAAFFSADWRHKRIDGELAKAADISGKRRAAAEQKHSKSDANARQVDPHARATSQPQSQLQANTSLRSDAGARADASKPGKGRAVRLDPAWTPGPDDITAAKAEGLTDSDIRREAPKFRDYWIAKPGAGGLKLDWPATWRNWCRRAAEQLGRSPAPADDRKAPGGFYAAADTPQLTAWDAWSRQTKGQRLPRDRNGGWLVESEWPPGGNLATGPPAAREQAA